jgi:protein TonB
MRPDGTLDSTGHFMNGKPDGTWYYCNDNGAVIMHKEYSLGKLLSTWDAQGHSVDLKNPSSDRPDVEAEFPGAAPLWQRYLIKNLRYPLYAQKNKITGQVVTGFVVDTAGRIRNEILIRSVEFTLDAEALRLIRESSIWIPATKNGQKVNSYKEQPIRFMLEY